MRRIFITEDQLKRVLSIIKEDTPTAIIAIDPEAINNSSQEVKYKTAQELSALNRKPNVKVMTTVGGEDGDITPTKLKALESRSVMPSSNIITEMENGEDIVSQVVDFIVNNYADQLDDMTPTSEVYSMISDAFFEVTGEDVPNEEMEEEVFHKLYKKIVLGESQNKTISFTKKQIKEAKRDRRIAEGVVLTKSDILKNL